MGPWQIINDNVMGGTSTSHFSVRDGVASFEGHLSRANGGGFASVRGVLIAPGLVSLRAFVLRIKGDGRRYKFTLRTDLQPNTPIHQCPLVPKPGVWEEHRLPIDQFAATFRGLPLPSAPPLEPARIMALGLLLADQQEGPFHLELARIEAIA